MTVFDGIMSLVGSFAMFIGGLAVMLIGIIASLINLITRKFKFNIALIIYLFLVVIGLLCMLVSVPK